MKKKIKIALITIISVIILGFLYLFAPCCILIGSMSYQQRKGCNYLNSITENDIPVWIERTEKYLKEYDPNEYGIGVYGLNKDNPVPKELKKLGIIRIDRTQNDICYVWVGGLDHTYLDVEKDEEGNFIFTAGYNDYNREVIWPKNKHE